MSSRAGRSERPRMRAALRRLGEFAAASTGFTLIEVVVALGVLVLVLGAIGGTVGVTVKGARATVTKLSVLQTAQSLLATLPQRDALRPGIQSGVANGYRWRMEVTPLAAAQAPDTPNPAKWTPLVVTLRVQGSGAPTVRLDTIRLVPRVGG